MSTSSQLLPESSRNLSTRSRKALQLCLQALASYGQAPVAQALGVHESTVSRTKEQLPNVIALLETIGMKVVPEHVKCFDPKDVDAFLHLARKRMEQIESADCLNWEGDP